MDQDRRKAGSNDIAEENEKYGRKMKSIKYIAEGGTEEAPSKGPLTTTPSHAPPTTAQVSGSNCSNCLLRDLLQNTRLMTALLVDNWVSLYFLSRNPGEG
jgi:hypothetical protein